VWRCKEQLNISSEQELIELMGLYAKQAQQADHREQNLQDENNNDPLTAQVQSKQMPRMVYRYPAYPLER